MDPTLHFDLLQTFVVVAETGELKKAAKKVFRSHSAVSMQIQRLEKIVGTAVINRSTRGVTLTEKGRILFSYSKRLLQLNRIALSALKDDDIAGKVSFGVPTDYAQAFLTQLLPALREKLPNLQPHIMCGRSRNIREKINSGALDIGIVAGEPDFPEEEYIGSERLVWASSHDFTYNKNEDLPVAIFDENCIVRDLTLKGLQKMKHNYKIVFSSPVLDNVADAVYNGIGVSLLPESLAPGAKTVELPQNFLGCKLPLSVNLIHSSSTDKTIVNIVSKYVKMAFGNSLNN